jgi:hypothetical protein
VTTVSHPSTQVRRLSNVPASARSTSTSSSTCIPQLQSSLLSKSFFPSQSHPDYFYSPQSLPSQSIPFLISKMTPRIIVVGGGCQSDPQSAPPMRADLFHSVWFERCPYDLPQWRQCRRFRQARYALLRSYPDYRISIISKKSQSSNSSLLPPFSLGLGITCDTGFFGGNSTKATSGINGALTRTQVDEKIADSVKQFYDDTLKSARDKARPDLIKVLTYKSAAAVEWLQDVFGLDLTLVSRLGYVSTPWL